MFRVINIFIRIVTSSNYWKITVPLNLLIRVKKERLITNYQTKRRIKWNPSNRRSASSHNNTKRPISSSKANFRERRRRSSRQSDWEKRRKRGRGGGYRGENWLAVCWSRHDRGAHRTRLICSEHNPILRSVEACHAGLTPRSACIYAAREDTCFFAFSSHPSCTYIFRLCN